MSFEINGVPVRNVASRRVVSPQFSFTAPDPNILGVAGGGAGTAVADGYYLMLAPLPLGQHTIRIQGALRFSTAAGDPFDLDLPSDVTFRINVVRPAHIMPPWLKLFGKSYGEWGAAWWQWALSIPADRNPVADPTGEFAEESQSGPVWFLPGTFGTDVERSFSVPKYKFLFFPIYNWVFGSGIFDCEPTVPGVPCDVDVLRAGAAAQTETAEVIEVTIDGLPASDVRRYRASSPDPFSLTYPENSVVGVPAGTYYPHVTDGYWLMLAPLSKGAHEIRYHVRAPDTLFGLIEFTVLHHITVE